MIKQGTLVLVADGEKLFLFRNDGGIDDFALALVKEEQADNPPSREHGTDTPGRTQSSTGERRSSYGETDWHTQAEELFARHAAEVLEGAAQAQREAGIVVIAAPRTLGELRKHYGRATKERLLGEIGKDLAGRPADVIAQELAAHPEF